MICHICRGQGRIMDVIARPGLPPRLEVGDCLACHSTGLDLRGCDEIVNLEMEKMKTLEKITHES